MALIAAGAKYYFQAFVLSHDSLTHLIEFIYILQRARNYVLLCILGRWRREQRDNQEVRIYFVLSYPICLLFGV